MTRLYTESSTEADCCCGGSAAFAVSLLRHFSLQPDVQPRIWARWESASTYLRCHLLFRILDDPALQVEWHRKLFNFVLDEWEVFNQVQIKFLGSPENVISHVLRRIGDPSFPDSKTWAYLCTVPGLVEDKNVARALVGLGLNSTDPFTREVADQLLDRFFE